MVKNRSTGMNGYSMLSVFYFALPRLMGYRPTSDWNTFMDFIHKHDLFDLVDSHLRSEALDKLWRD